MPAGFGTALPEFARRPEWIGAVVLAGSLTAGAVVIIRRIIRRRPTAAQIELQRRTSIHRLGKLGDGEIIDISDNAIVYSYSVAGVGYTASQDFTGLESMLPADRMHLIGPVSLKFMARNPANSIVLCEEWSGLRRRGAPTDRSANPA